LHAKAVLAICGAKVTVQGLEHLDLSRKHMYVSNHASLLDIPVVLHSIPDTLNIMYKREIQYVPFFGWGMKFGPYISVDRGSGMKARRSLESAIEKVRNGAAVLMFAEGTRSRDGKMHDFKRGAFRVASQAGVQIVPLTINGSYNVLHHGSMTIKPGPIELIVHPPIDPPAAGDDKAEAAVLANVFETISSHYKNQG
jgi:1-acyl-sn-glycerol-3-phosphate acyltransferase